MNDHPVEWGVASLIPALEANMRDFLVAYGDAQGCERYVSPELVQSITSVPFPLYNMTFAAGLTAETADEAIAAAIGRIRPRHVPFFWCAGPSTQPADLGKYLIRHGFVLAEAMPGMAVALADLPERVPAPDDLAICSVDDERTLTDWVTTLLASYDAPSELAGPILPVERDVMLARRHQTRRHYVGYRAGRPVAASALQLSSGVAGIMAVGTRHDERGQGIGAALTLAALLDARSAGYWVGVLQATQMGYPVYRRLGFRDVCTIRLYLWHEG